MPGPRRIRDNNTGEEFTMDWYGDSDPTPADIKLYRQQQEDRPWYSKAWDTATHGVDDAMSALGNMHPVDALMGEEQGLKQSAQSLWDYAPKPVQQIGESLGNLAKGAAAMIPPVTAHRYRPEDDPALRITGQPDPVASTLGWQVSTPAQDIAAGMVETGQNAARYAGTALGNLSSNASDLADRYLFAPGSEPYQPPIEHRPIASPILHAAASIPELGGIASNTALTQAEQGNYWGAGASLIGSGALMYGLGRAHAGGEGEMPRASWDPEVAPPGAPPRAKGVKRTTPVEPDPFDMESGWGGQPAQTGAPQDITNNPFLSEDIALIKERGTIQPDQLGSAEAIQEYAAHLRGEAPQAPDLPPVQPPDPVMGASSDTPALDIHSPFLAEDIQLINEQGTIRPEQLGTPEAIQQYAEEIRQGAIPPEQAPDPAPTDPWARQPLEQPPPGPPEDLPLQPTGPDLPPPTDLPLQNNRTPSNPELMAERARFSQALEQTNRPPAEPILPELENPEAPPAPVDQPGPGSTFGGVRGFGQWTGREIWDVWKKEAMDMGEDPTHLDMAKQVADAFGENITHSDDLADFDHYMLDKYGDAYTNMAEQLVEHGTQPTPQPTRPTGFSLSDSPTTLPDLRDPADVPFAEHEAASANFPPITDPEVVNLAADQIARHGGPPPPYEGPPPEPVVAPKAVRVKKPKAPKALPTEITPEQQKVMNAIDREGVPSEPVSTTTEAPVEKPAVKATKPRKKAATAKETSPKQTASHPTAQQWQARLSELDAKGAPDTAYRDIMSTAGKNKLKKGETWRGKVIEGIDYFEKLNKKIETATERTPKKSQSVNEFRKDLFRRMEERIPDIKEQHALDKKLTEMWRETDRKGPRAKKILDLLRAARLKNPESGTGRWMTKGVSPETISAGQALKRVAYGKLPMEIGDIVENYLHTGQVELPSPGKAERMGVAQPEMVHDTPPRTKKPKVDPAQALADIFNKKAEEVKDTKWNPDVNKRKVGELPPSKSVRTQMIVDELTTKDMRELLADDKALADRAAKGGVSVEGLKQTFRRFLKEETGAVPLPSKAQLKKAARVSFDVANQARMTSMLSGLAVHKSVAGNIGAHLIAALEHRTLKPFKVLTNVKAIGRDLRLGWKHHTNPAQTAGIGNFNVFGRVMGAGDYAATESLVRAGISRADAKEILLTNPNAISKWPPLKGRAGQFFVPFRTIPFNQFGQALTRWKKYPEVYTAAVVLGALSGAKVKDKEKLALLSAFAGPYALPFLAGAAISGGARNLEGISPIPEWGLVKTIVKPWAAFTESPARRWLRTNMGFGAQAAREKKHELGQSVGKMPGARGGRSVRRGH